ncbi:MAG TPA: ABC transporter substrate-binding protein [Ktedonobacteraceae bacterium]|nr:ABC transporter substrate-binding protein [Ktedonobacteraceae bacterium]
MAYFMFTRRGPLTSFIIKCMVLVLLVFGYTACAEQGSNTTSALGLVIPGVLTVGSDTTNPPQEFIDPSTQQATGFDINLIMIIAQRLGLKVQVLTTKIDQIMSDLENKRYDVAISAIPITPANQAVNLIPYFNAGSSLLVRNGNPAHIQGLADVCGRMVGVQSDTREQLDLQNASEICQQQGKPAISLTSLKNQFDVVQLLKDRRVVATYQASATSDYFIKLNPGYFAVGGPIYKIGLEGIAINKDNTALYQAMQATLEGMKTDTTYQQLVQKWGLVNEEIAGVDQRRTL